MRARALPEKCKNCYSEKCPRCGSDMEWEDGGVDIDTERLYLVWCKKCEIQFSATLHLRERKKRHWGDNPEEMTDNELICAYISFNEGFEPPMGLYERYYQDCLIAEIKRRGITDKQIEEAYDK